jgi:hypothetical protein
VKLEGSLDAFSLPDIFQLLSFTKKSGGLHLRRADVCGCVYFQDGAVTGASSDDARQELARRLMSASIAGDGEFEAAVARAESEPGVGVARALLDAGAVDPDAIKSLAHENAVEAVFDLLRWPEGDFSFSLDESGPDDVGILVPVDELVASARERLGVWEQAYRVLSSLDAVLVTAPSITADATLTPAEWALLALVDGRRSVSDVAGLTATGEFAVVTALAALVERALLVPRASDAQEPVRTRTFELLSRLESSDSTDSFEHAVEFAPSAETVIEPAPVAAAEPVLDETPVEDVQDVPGVSDVEQPAIEHDGDMQDIAIDEAPAAAERAEAPLPAPSPFARTKAPAFAHLLDAPSVETYEAEAPPQPSTDGYDERRLVPDLRSQVTPTRPEGFGPRRRPDFPEDSSYLAQRSPLSAAVGGAAAAQAAPVLDPEADTHIEHDPSVNKSLLLRLIAGVRGL